MALGLAGAVIGLVAWSVPAASRVGDLDLSARLATSGALESSRAELMTARLLRPGRPAVATSTVRNQSGRTLRVRLNAPGPVSDLDSALIVRFDAGSRRIYEASLGHLRAGARIRFRLRSGEARPLRFSVRLRDGQQDGYAGRYERVALQLQEEAVP